MLASELLILALGTAGAAPDPLALFPHGAIAFLGIACRALLPFPIAFRTGTGRLLDASRRRANVRRGSRRGAGPPQVLHLTVIERPAGLVLERWLPFREWDL